MGKFDVPYLWEAKGRNGQRYPFYRRKLLGTTHRVPVCTEDGHRLLKGQPGFWEAFERIHASFEASPVSSTAATGSLGHLIEVYRAAPEFLSLADSTRKDYGVYLDLLKEKHGHRPIAMPREAILKLRDEYASTPRKANYLISVLRLIFTYAEDRPTTFHLPKNWINPARRPKKLRTGAGYRPWEEVELVAFRKQWPSATLERTLFETFLNTGQRGGDIAPMVRPQYFRGEIAVAQEKTKERVWIPASRDLRAILDPWLRLHKHLVLFPTATGRPLKVDHMRHLMRDAIRSASLPDDCTLHGLRYSFATRAIELGLDWQTIESIVGHKTAQMASKYTEKRRRARLAIATLDAARKANKRAAKVKTTADRGENHRGNGGPK